MVEIYPTSGVMPPNGTLLIENHSLVLDTSTMLVEVAGTAVTGTFTTIMGGGLLEPAWEQFVPDAPLVPNATVTVTISTASGLASAFTAAFTVGSNADTIAPTGGEVTGYKILAEGHGYEIELSPVADDSGDGFVLVTSVNDLGSGNDTILRIAKTGETSVVPVTGGDTSCDTTVPEGTYVAVTARAFDASGNAGALSGDTFTTDPAGCACALGGTSGVAGPGAIVAALALLLSRRRRV